MSKTKPEEPWRTNTAEDPFWKHNGRVEIVYIDGTVKIWVNPHMAVGEMLNVTKWRPTEKMPVVVPPSLEVLKKNIDEARAAKAKVPKATERVMPTVFKHLLKVEWYRSFSFRERIAILFGANCVVMVGIACQHNPGQVHPMILGKVTPSTTPDDHVRGIIENMLQEEPKDPVVHE